MLRKLGYILPLLICFYSAKGQSKRAIFIGLQPAITVEPDYEKNEFDINVLPFVFQSSISKRVDYRLVTIVNYHFGPENELSDIGLELGFPVFLKKKDELFNPSAGFFIGPAFLYVRNVQNDHYAAIFAIEPGYFFEFNSRFSFSLQLQIGATYFMYDSEATHEWKSHFGFKGNLGFWVNKPNN